MKFKVNTKEELDQLSKEELVQLSIHLQEQLVSTWESLLANNHKKFKSTSEHIHPDQLSLFNDAEVTVDTATEEEMEEAEPSTTKKSKKGKKHNLDFSGLPEKVIHHNLENPTCDICGSKMQELKPTVTRVLKYVPAKCYVEKHVVHNYVCNSCSKDTDSLVSKSAPEPDVTRIFDKSIASAEIVADFIYKKYMMGTPLYRIEKDLKTRGLIMSRQIISNWVIKAAEMYFKYIFKAMHEDARNLTYRHMDETTLVVIEDKKMDNRSKSYEWVLVSGRSEEKQMALYFYNLTRQHKFVDEILGENAKGYVHSDGYGAYQGCTFVNVGCLAHVRR